MGESVKTFDDYKNIAKKAKAKVLNAVKRKDWNASGKAAETWAEANEYVKEHLKSQYEQQKTIMLSFARKCKSAYVASTIETLNKIIAELNEDSSENMNTITSDFNDTISKYITPTLKECQGKEPKHKPFVAPPSKHAGGRRTRRVKRGRKGTRRQ